MQIEEIAREVVDCGYRIHKGLGPGLLELVYEVVLAKLLIERGFFVERQKPVSITFEGLQFNEGFRADLLVDGKLLIELKSVENLAPVHSKQVITYLRLLNLPLGLLMNFGAATFKEGVKRIVNNHSNFASSCAPIRGRSTHAKPRRTRRRTTMNRHVNAIAGRLSLRPPQRFSLEILDRVMEIVPPGKTPDTASAMEAIRSEFPSVEDFDRDFPSLCFALATGVGKTRLMGAFISYLHLAHGINNFFVLALGRGGIEEARLEDYIVSGLVDFDDISYDDHADLLYDLAAQTVQHFRTYLLDEEAAKVLRCYQRDIARFIHSQMQEHYWEETVGYEVIVSKGFTELKRRAYSQVAGESMLDFRESPADKSNMARYLFTGFSRCLYPPAF